MVDEAFAELVQVRKQQRILQRLKTVEFDPAFDWKYRRRRKRRRENFARKCSFPDLITPSGPSPAAGLEAFSNDAQRSLFTRLTQGIISEYLLAPVIRYLSARFAKHSNP